MENKRLSVKQRVKHVRNFNMVTLPILATWYAYMQHYHKLFNINVNIPGPSGTSQSLSLFSLMEKIPS